MAPSPDLNQHWLINQLGSQELSKILMQIPYQYNERYACYAALKSET